MESRLKLNNIQTLITETNEDEFDRNVLIGWTDSGEAWVFAFNDIEKIYQWRRSKNGDFPTIECAEKESE